MRNPSRRQVLAGAAAAALGTQAIPAQPTAEAAGQAPLPTRVLGRTGRELPVLGLGCWPIGKLADEQAALATIRRAYDSGARYIDTAHSYSRGDSEIRVGKVLKDLPRDSVFLASKSLKRDGATALAQLDLSLQRLQTNYIDLFQVHEVRSEADVQAVFAPGGVVEALEQARAQGKIKHIGITGHRDPKFLLQAIRRYPFDTALVPINPIDCHHKSFTWRFLPEARKLGVAVIAMKVFAGGKLVEDFPGIPSSEFVRFSLSQKGVALAIVGAEDTTRWDDDRNSATMSLLKPKQQEDLIVAVSPHKGKDSEWYKNV